MDMTIGSICALFFLFAEIYINFKGDKKIKIISLTKAKLEPLFT